MSTQRMREGDSPILIVGGFASSARQYEPLRAILADVSGRPVSIAPIGRLDWLGVVASDSYGALLGILDRAVRAALAAPAAQRVTLVAHSAGGVLARIYLGDQPYGPRRLCYGGHRRVAALVTLGTPHTAVGEGRQGGLNQIAYVQRAYPGAYWPAVRYVSVIGKGILGAADGPPPARVAWQSYRLLGVEGAQWGDGVVPLESGLLAGSRQLVIPGLRHDDRPGQPWYGSSPAIVRAWWERAVDIA
ncbi:lipase [Oscillochloris sp. ZM17-4]|uniref:esterase/lipase family protein n=1 Tax=Oscillochloris sp. ZM17-4 TaxID=2866714 RepID=UPI001C731ADD|nr:lipase [Oscillochloris sp. ZM17-4]MBX0327376.1 lipase [Oscillochloris sp. ZM17-4]